MRAPARRCDLQFEAAVNANIADLLSYLERRVLPAADAADVLSDALLNAWRKRAAIPEGEAARPWLFAFTRNALLNTRRSARRRSAAVDALREFVIQSHATAAPSTEDAYTVRAAVDALPAVHRELVQLVHWDGFTVAGAAEVLGISASTARSRYAAAKERLRALLEASETAPFAESRQELT